MNIRCTILLLLFSLCASLSAQINCIKNQTSKDDFPLIYDGLPASVFVDPDECASVKNTASLFASDLGLVSDSKSNFTETKNPFGKSVIVIASLGKNSFVDSLEKQGKIDLSKLKGKWESFFIKTIKNPTKDIDQALLIVGSDRRGVAYGAFSISEAAGVSPLYWWADVPVIKSKNLYLKNIEYLSREPSVKYRGIFINDEGWGLHKWAKETFETDVKGIGPKTYAKVCELILRLKGNMLAPAMHPCSKAFYSIDENKKVADSYGIIITTSHCEPLLFNNVTEWNTKTMGPWNYLTNKDSILSALDQRVKQAAMFENIYTIGIRGLHDAKMENIEGHEVQVLEDIFKRQREIISKYTGKPAEEVPQIFVPYKETLDIYEKSLKLPEDVILVWPNDNYGYIKRLSNSTERARKGGAGVYYHLSYLGAPHDYLWLCTTPPVLMFEELKKAYDFGAKEYWLLNVGDIKPMELGIVSFFDMAWDIDKALINGVNKTQAEFLAKIFGAKYQDKFQFVLDEFYRLAWSRKPEFMGWEREWDAPKYNELSNTEFSFENYNDAQQRLADYSKIANICRDIYSNLPKDYRASFFELLGYPVEASLEINRKFLLAQLSRQLASENKFAEANWAAKESKLAFDKIESLNQKYNSLLDGKWNGMMMLAPGWCAKYQLMPELEIFDSAGEKSVDIKPQKAKSKLENCTVLNLKKYSKKYEQDGISLNSIDGIGYDWHSIQLGKFGERTFNPKDLNSPRFEYQFKAPGASCVKVYVYTVPSFPANADLEKSFGISIDGKPPVVAKSNFKEMGEPWRTQVLRNGALDIVEFELEPTDKAHTISFICGGPGVVIQRVVIDWGGLKKTYVGPSANLN